MTDGVPWKKPVSAQSGSLALVLARGGDWAADPRASAAATGNGGAPIAGESAITTRQAPPSSPPKASKATTTLPKPCILLPSFRPCYACPSTFTAARPPPDCPVGGA